MTLVDANVLLDVVTADRTQPRRGYGMFAMR